ncbi:TonB-dependent receptor [Sphingopyxis sp.]|uniref:TonB-dependent receptor n=1 Tax=Sphingopyxis sp. TaxID=1908224 RepID=UPI002FC67F35
MKAISILLTSAGAATLCPGPVQAQEAPLDSGEIVVTAQKRSENINDVGISITALSGEAMATQNITQVSDFVKVVPGLNYTRSNYGTPIFTIRGIGFNETSLSAAPTVTLYLDEVPLPVPAMSSGVMLDLERVEVLKGPQGTLFGQNSTGGAINFIANKPTRELEAGFSLTVGRYDQVDTEAYVSGPIADTLLARVAVRKEYSGPWQKSNSRDDRLGKVDRVSGRLLLQWQPIETLRLNFNVNGWQDRSDTQAGQFLTVINPSPSVPAVLRETPPSPERPRAADWDPDGDFFTHDDFYQLSLRADYDIADEITLTSISAHQRLDRRNRTDTEGSPFQAFTVLNAGSAETFSQELRLAGRLGQDIRWVLGGNYQRDSINDTTQPQTRTSSFPFPGVEARSANKIRTYAAFGNIDWEVVPDVTVQAGARYSDQHRAYEGCTYDLGDGGVSAVFGSIASARRGETVTIAPGSCVTLGPDFLPAVYRDNLNEDNLSWRLGVNWKLDASALLYANVSRGYKNGSFVTSGATFSGQLFPATQESVLAYEAGFKLGLFDRAVQLNGAGFFYEYDDKQVRGRVLDPTFGLQNRLINLPRSRVQGGELQLVVAPVPALRFNLAASYVDSKILGSFNNISALGREKDLGGENFPLTPKWQLNGDVQYDIEVGKATLLYFGVGATYQSQTNAALGQEALLRMKSYALVDLRAGVRDIDDRWRISGFVRNLANTYYYTNVVLPGPDTAARYAGRGRSYGVTLAYQYR